MPIDLSSRIQMINRTNQMENFSPISQEEPLSVTTTEAIWEETKESPVSESISEPVETITLEDLAKKIDALVEVVNENTAMLAKINKHVNATQKMLKKGKK